MTMPGTTADRVRWSRLRHIVVGLVLDVDGRPSNGDPRASLCPDQPLRKRRGCCPPSWRCIFSSCVAPGITCRSDDDYSSDRFCALVLAEPRCHPRPNWCRTTASSAACPPARAGTGQTSRSASPRRRCNAVKLYVSNGTRASVRDPIAIDLDLARVRAGPGRRDAGRGDAGTQGTRGRGGCGRVPDRTIVGYTTDGLLPGEPRGHDHSGDDPGSCRGERSRRGRCRGRFVRGGERFHARLQRVSDSEVGSDPRRSVI